MRKFLVVLLVLAIAGGAFTQEWTVTGEAEAASKIDLTTEPYGFGGEASAKVTIQFEDGPWAFSFPVEISTGDGVALKDAELVYNPGDLEVTVSWDSWSEMGVEVNYDDGDNGFHFELGDVILPIFDLSFLPGSNPSLNALYGWYTIGGGLLGVNYVGAEFDWFRTSWVNVVELGSNTWDRFEGIGFKYGVDALSFGFMLNNFFGEPDPDHDTVEFKNAFTNLTFGVKYDTDIKVSAMFAIDPGTDLGFGVYAGTKFSVIELIDISIDASAAIAGGNTNLNFGFSAGHGSNESFDPNAKLTLKGFDLINDPRKMSLDFYAAYNRYIPNDDDEGGDWGEGSGPWAYLKLGVPDLMASTFGMNFQVWGGINGEVSDLSYYATVGFAGGITGSDFNGALGVYAGAGYSTDIAENLSFGIGLDIGLELTNNFKDFGFGFAVGPELVWKVWSNGSITFGYNISAGIGPFGDVGDYGNFLAQPLDEFKVVDHNIGITFKWTF